MLKVNMIVENSRPPIAKSKNEQNEQKHSLKRPQLGRVIHSCTRSHDPPQPSRVVMSNSFGWRARLNVINLFAGRIA